MLLRRQLILTLSLLGLALAPSTLLDPGQKTASLAGKAVRTPNPSSHPNLQNLPIDLQGLAAAVTSSREQENSDSTLGDEAIIREQVADAAASLRDARPEERITGAEQLAAYPTPEAERLLVHTLKTDTAAEVRSTAAASLREIENPDRKTLTALFDALEDPTETVQQSALDTLTDFVLRLDSDSKRYRKLIASLKKTLTTKKLATDVREDLKAFLNDQNPG
jgi:hypothetical protein